MSDTIEQLEWSCVGALLAKPDAYWQIVDLDPGDFASDQAREIYSTIATMVTRGEAVDVATVCERLDQQGSDAWHEIQRSLPAGGLAGSPSNITAYSHRIKQQARRRRIRTQLREATQALESGQDVDSVAQELLETVSLAPSSGDKSWRDVLRASLQSAEDAGKEADGAIRGLTTTLPTLDRLTRGLWGDRLAVLAGRPGRYKSALAMQIAERNAQKGHPVGVIPLEMGGGELADRAIARRYRVNAQDYAVGDPKILERIQEDWDPHMTEWPIRIDDRAHTMQQILQRITEWRYKYAIKLAIIDYIGLVKVPGKSQNERIGVFTRELKLLAMRLEMPIMILSQLNRQCEQEGRGPRLSDLRDSGNIEQDADLVMFTHYHAKENVHQLILAKQRGGPAGKVIDLHIDAESYDITEASRPTLRPEGSLAAGAGGPIQKEVSKSSPLF